MSFNKWLNSLEYIHAMGILLNNKNECAIDIYNNLDGSQRNYAEWKKSISRGYMLYGPISATV